jgi:hypothetical protein
MKDIEEKIAEIEKEFEDLEIIVNDIWVRDKVTKLKNETNKLLSLIPMIEVDCPEWKKEQDNHCELIGIPILAIVEHFHTKGRRYAILNRVNEDDVIWRTCDDNSELSYDWNVIYWSILPNIKTIK